MVRVSWGPVRSISVGGVAFGVAVIVAGIFVFLASQGLLPFEPNWQAFCGIGLVLLGIVIMGGVLWGRRMARGAWRRWVGDWDQGSQQRPPGPPP